MRPEDIDWEEFIQPASDERGHGSTEGFRIPPQQAERVSIHVASLPEYSTRSGLFRHSLARHLNWLDDVQEVIQNQPFHRSRRAAVEGMSQVLREEEAQAEFEQIITRAERLISRMLGEGAEKHAAALIKSLLRHVSEMAPGYWKERYQAHLEMRFGAWIGGSGR